MLNKTVYINQLEFQNYIFIYFLQFLRDKNRELLLQKGKRNFYLSQRKMKEEQEAFTLSFRNGITS